MQAIDIQQLGVKEKKAFAWSFQPALGQRGMRNLVLSLLVALTAVVVFSIYGIERIPMAAMALFVLVILLLEKISYFYEIQVYRSLVRALARQIEQLESTAKSPSDLSSAGAIEHSGTS